MIRKVYIFFTYDVHVMGGTQTFTFGKGDYLQKHGWDVLVISHFDGHKGFVIPWFQECGGGDVEGLTLSPSRFTKPQREKVLKNIIEKIGDISQANEVVIESHASPLSLWAEMVSKKINARHIIFLCNETYYEEHKAYQEFADFFRFKYFRKELFARSFTSIKCILGENFDDKIPEVCETDFAERDSVGDYFVARVHNIKRKDYNIMYLGRGSKEYVPLIFEGVKKFAQKHLNNSICFIIVGEELEKVRNTIDELKTIDNISIIETGNLYPIPQEVFKKTDVVIAGAGCARCSMNQGVPIIIPDINNFMANGVLGYTTHNFMMSESSEQQMTYEDALEDVLISKHYLNNRYQPMPSKNIEETYAKQLKYLEYSRSEYGYYPIDHVCKMLPQYDDVTHRKVILYGAGRIAIEMYELFDYPDDILCFGVTDKKNNPDEIFGKPVLELDKVAKHQRNALVIIATIGDEAHMREYARKLGFIDVV